MAVSPSNELPYKYTRGDRFVLSITDRMPRQSNLEDEEPVYHTNAGISIPESVLDNLVSVRDDGKFNNYNNYLMLVIDKTAVDKIEKVFFGSWSKAYVAMVQKIVESYPSSDAAEEAFKLGKAAISNYSAVNGNLDIRILEVF